MSREQFLERVRIAAQAGQAYRVHVDPLPAETGYVGYQGDICQAYAAEAEAVGGKCHIVKGSERARQTLLDLIHKYKAKRALAWQHPLLESLNLADLLNENGIELDQFASLKELEAEPRRARMLSADIGITSANYAIAETGSLAVGAKPGQERLASLLPPVHVAVITRTQIVPDLIDAFRSLEGQVLPSNLALITGPSKTGDIELQLTTGVHGPGNWHIVVIDDQ